MKTYLEKAGEPLSLIEPKQWQRVQDLFAKIIRVNVAFLDSSGVPIVQAKQVAPLISDVAVPLAGTGLYDPPKPVIEALLKKSRIKRLDIELYGLRYCLLRIDYENNDLGAFVIGPVLIGKRENDDFYRSLCQESGLDPETYLDRIREVRLYSHVGISMVLDFLYEMTGCFLEQAMTAREAELLFPKFIEKSRGKISLLDMRYQQELANALLDVALGLVKADSGSVLLLDEPQKYFHIQTARGLPSEVIRDTCIPLRSGIAGLVALRGKPTLIQQEVKDRAIKKRLKKPKLKSSFVIPLNYRGRALGVFCLNAESVNDRFNQENLTLLDQLGKIAGIAFARLSEE